MNKKELVDAIVSHKEAAHLTKKDVEAVLTNAIDTIKATVKKGDDMTLVGFGTFTSTKRAARKGVNPSTGDTIQIKASTVPKFRPGKDFKTLVNGK